MILKVGMVDRPQYCGQTPEPKTETNPPAGAYERMPKKTINDRQDTQRSLAKKVASPSASGITARKASRTPPGHTPRSSTKAKTSAARQKSGGGFVLGLVLVGFVFRFSFFVCFFFLVLVAAVEVVMEIVVVVRPDAANSCQTPRDKSGASAPPEPCTCVQGYENYQSA